ALTRDIEATVPGARVRWHYRLVVNGLAVVLPTTQVAALARLPGVAEVWPDVRYHTLALSGGPAQIRADKLWGPGRETARAGRDVRPGTLHGGLDASTPYFSQNGFQSPPGFPKGRTKYATPKVIVQRAFPPPSTTYKNASLPFDPALGFHATHVAGIAAGDH